MVEFRAVIEASGVTLPGTLMLPEPAHGIVVFAHASSGSKFSQIDNFLARQLRDAGFGTLRCDLLTQEEAADPNAAFDVPLLARRLSAAAAWVESQPACTGLPLGYIGTGMGAAAACVAAAGAGSPVQAVVCRNGRLDLADEVLPFITAPTLLIVRPGDPAAIQLSYEAISRLGGEKELALIPGTAPLLEEPKALDQLGVVVVGWFWRYLRALVLAAAGSAQ